MHAEVVPYDTHVTFRFSTTPKVSSISAEKFQLWTTAATPTQIADPWQAVDLSRDYNSISRTLTLYLKVTLSSGTYEVRGGVAPNLLYSASGTPLYLEGEFTYNAAATPLVILPPEEQVIVIEDKSVRGDVYTSSETIYEANPDFYIVSTDPAEDEPIVEPNYASGRVTLKFSGYPNPVFLSSSYIKAQRKKIGREFSRWEAVDVNRTMDPIYPYVYVDFPSTDSPPAYSTDAAPAYSSTGKVHFVSGYKYRIRISKDVGV